MMSHETPSFVADLIARRGDIAACRTPLETAYRRAQALEPWLHAFTHLPSAPPATVNADSPLAGLPIGVKDLIDTADMPTAYGSPIYANHQPTADAAIVAAIRQAGGVIFGKTVTTEFAWRHPGPTVNPWRPTHTPGGSSSGSAAAVGAGIVPLALGTQTVGSVIRPAAYCGAVGYKPSFGRVARDGAHPFSTSLDHIGFFAASVEIAALAHAVFVDGQTQALATQETWRDHFSVPLDAPRLGVVRTPFWSRVTPAQQHNFEASLEHLQAAGAHIVEMPFGADLEAIVDALHVLLRVDAYRALGPLAARHPEQVSATLHALLDEGAAIDEARYRDALALQTRLRGESAALLAGCDALVTIPATGEAPEGLADTGDATFCAPWTMLGVPAVTVPSGAGPNKLPLGLQLVGAFRRDLATLRVAAWIEQALPDARQLYARGADHGATSE